MHINVKTSANPENVMSSITWTSQCDENGMETEQMTPQDEVVIENRETIETGEALEA